MSNDMASSSHLMKTTRRGRPFVKVRGRTGVCTHCRTLTTSLPLLLYHYVLDHIATFSRHTPIASRRESHNHGDIVGLTISDDACINLSSLKFSQSTRAPDPKDTSRIITTTTTTTFTMSRDMARGLCQHFIEAHLIENATDLSSKVFKDRGVYMLTPKGLHILERFITKNGISADHLLTMFATQPICMKLLHLERRSQDDEVLITK